LLKNNALPPTCRQPSNAGGFLRQSFIKSENDRGKENINQVNPALAAAGGPLAVKIIIHHA